MGGEAEEGTRPVWSSKAVFLFESPCSAGLGLRHFGSIVLTLVWCTLDSVEKLLGPQGCVQERCWHKRDFITGAGMAPPGRRDTRGKVLAGWGVFVSLKCG